MNIAIERALYVFIGCLSSVPSAADPTVVVTISRERKRLFRRAAIPGARQCSLIRSELVDLPVDHAAHGLPRCVLRLEFEVYSPVFRVQFRVLQRQAFEAGIHDAGQLRSIPIHDHGDIRSVLDRRAAIAVPGTDQRMAFLRARRDRYRNIRTHERAPKHVTHAVSLNAAVDAVKSGSLPSSLPAPPHRFWYRLTHRTETALRRSCASAW